MLYVVCIFLEGLNPTLYNIFKAYRLTIFYKIYMGQILDFFGTISRLFNDI